MEIWSIQHHASGNLLEFDINYYIRYQSLWHHVPLGSVFVSGYYKLFKLTATSLTVAHNNVDASNNSGSKHRHRSLHSHNEHEEKTHA